VKPFVFRPQPALDLRRKQEEAALRALALAEGELQRAGELVSSARTAIATAGDNGKAALATVRAAHELVWYRNWMVGLERDLARARQREEERRIDVQAAQHKAMQARRAVRALERLKDRVWKEYETASRREDQKALDLLGSLQYAARHLRQGEDQ
jgi:flagellar export protein FliJ